MMPGEGSFGHAPSLPPVRSGWGARQSAGRPTSCRRSDFVFQGAVVVVLTGSDHKSMRVDVDITLAVHADLQVQFGTGTNLPESCAVGLGRSNLSFDGFGVVFIQSGFRTRQGQQSFWVFAIEVKTEGPRLDIDACNRDLKSFQENTDFPKLPFHHSHLVSA